MKRQHISSGSKWEEIVGYSRAVRIGNCIEVSGTTAIREGELQGKGDVYTQSKVCLEIITEAINKAGGTLNDVTRTRIYVTDISKWELVGKAHGEVFGLIKPATTMIQVSALIDPEILVEIEATAVIS
ncbi:MAG: RidA family protein [Saprospiraceae bacterium]